MRSPRTGTRLATITFVASLCTALPASAQSVGLAPPVDMSIAPPADTGAPPPSIVGGFTVKTACVTSQNQGVVLKNMAWGQTQLQLDTVHTFATGKGQMVAVIDTGVSNHPYFEGRVEYGKDYIVSADGSAKDCDGHGTEVAGIIAGRKPSPEVGFQGMAPDAKILSIRQSSNNYEGKTAPSEKFPQGEPKSAGDLDTLTQAVMQAANNPKVTVINMSVDNCRPASASISVSEKRLQRALRHAVDQNKVVVASAGNKGPICTEAANGSDPKKPQWIITPPWFADDVLSVAAIQQNGDLAEFSMQGPWVSVAAPGTDIISLDPASGTLANRTVEGGKQIPIQGTSFSAPYVAGLAALIRERYPSLNARQVMDRIKMTALHPAAPGGRDGLVGYGMINPVAALTTMIPAEADIKPDKAITVPAEMPPYFEKNWTPLVVAVIGAASGVGFLLLTLLIMRTVRRKS